MTGVIRVTWMTKMSGTTGLAWITRMNGMTGISRMGRMSGMTSSSMKKPEKDLILQRGKQCDLENCVYHWKNSQQNVVVLYQLRKLQKWKKLIPKMPEITNGGPQSLCFLS